MQNSFTCILPHKTPICLSSHFYLHDLADDDPCIIRCTVLHGDGVLCKKLYSNEADHDLLRGQHHFVFSHSN